MHFPWGFWQLVWLCLKTYLLFIFRISSLFLGSGLMATSLSILLLQHTSCCCTLLWTAICRHVSVKSSFALWKSHGKHFQIMDTWPSPRADKAENTLVSSMHIRNACLCSNVNAQAKYLFHCHTYQARMSCAISMYCSLMAVWYTLKHGLTLCSHGWGHGREVWAAWGSARFSLSHNVKWP